MLKPQTHFLEALKYLPFILTLIEATGCYMPNGSSSIDDQWPCSPAAGASICCGVADYCLGSVMCMDASADNALSIQGCTDPSWPAACNPVCPGMTSDWYIPVQMCSSKDGASKVCCEDEYTCCGASGVVDLAVFTAVSKPPGLARATASRTSSGGSTAATASLIATQTAADAFADGGSCKSREISIGLGVGLGLPLILALTTAGLLMFRGRQLRGTERENGSKPPAVQPSNGQVDGSSNLSNQEPVRNPMASELHGRGTNSSVRGAQELPDSYR